MMDHIRQDLNDFDYRCALGFKECTAAVIKVVDGYLSKFGAYMIPPSDASDDEYIVFPDEDNLVY